MALSQMRVDVTILYIFAQAVAWSLALSFGFIIAWSFKDDLHDWLKKTSKKQKTEDDFD